MFVTLMYHSVDRRLRTPIAVTEEAFEAQLALLVRERIPVLTLAEVLEIVSGASAAPERGVFLTLDDGYTDNLYAALPRLREHGLEATLFVPTAHVGGDNRWDVRARHRARHLDWPELERWLAGGGQIGGHTHAHEHAAEVAPARMRESIAVNRRLLRERLGVDPVAFAYPYGVDTPAVRAEVAEHYRVAWVGSGGRGTWDPDEDPLRLNRIWVDPRWGAHELARELDALFDELATGWAGARQGDGGANGNGRNGAGAHAAAAHAAAAQAAAAQAAAAIGGRRAPASLPARPPPGSNEPLATDPRPSELRSNEPSRSDLRSNEPSRSDRRTNEPSRSDRRTNEASGSDRRTTEPRAFSRARATARVVIVVDRWEMPLAHPVVPRLRELLEAGWDAHVVHNLGGAIDRLGIAGLPDDVLRERIHPPPAHLQKRAPRRDLAGGLIGTLRRHPVRSSLALAGAGEPGARYLRAVLLALAPDLVDLTSEAAARHYAPLAGALAARVVASGAAAAHVPCDAVYAEHETDLPEAPGEPGRRPIAVIAPPIDRRLLGWEPTCAVAGSCRVLAIGPLTWQQGHEHLLEALARLRVRGGPALSARLVGSGPHESAVAFARAQLELEAVVELRRPGRRAALLEQLRWADVLVHAAVDPGCSPPWLRDAQAAALPLVATAFPGAGATEPALVVPARDAEALAAALEHVFSDVAVRRALGEAARRRARSLLEAGAGGSPADFRELYERALA